jgi:hypothetical protein
MADNNDQAQFFMFTGIGAVGMGAIIGLVYWIGFSDGGSEPQAVAAADTPSSQTSSTPVPGMPNENDSSDGGGLSNPILDARAAARATMYKNNLKQVMIASHNYHDVHRNMASNKKGLSWRVHLLPFLEHNALYRQFNLNEPWDSPQNKPLIAKMPKFFETPGVADGQTGIVRFNGQGAFHPDEETRYARITDGTSNTIFCTIVDASAAVPWTKPADYDYDPQNPKAKMLEIAGGCLAAFCDGSVYRLQSNIDLKTLQNLITHSDGEVVNFR